MKLLKHWANHNDSHKESFIKWRDIASNKGLNEVVNNLNKAIEMMDKSTESLLLALKEMEQMNFFQDNLTIRNIMPYK